MNVRDELAGDRIADEARLLDEINGKLGDLLSRTAIVVHPGDTLVIAYDHNLSEYEYAQIMASFATRIPDATIAIVERASHFAVVRRKEPGT